MQGAEFILPGAEELTTPPTADEMEVDDAPSGEQVPEPAPNPLASYPPAGTPEELIAWLKQKHGDFEYVVMATGIINLWRIAHASLFGQNPDSPGEFDTQTIGIDGEEQLRFRVAEPRSFWRQQNTMATGQRAAFQAVALNTDTSALAMAPVVDAAVDYFYRREMPDSKERRVVGFDGGYGAGYAWARWERWAGDEVKIGVKQVKLPLERIPKEQLVGITEAAWPTAPIDAFGPSGAPICCVLRPWEEFHEVRSRNQHLWRCAKERRSRFELMALYPKEAERLRAVSAEPSILEQEIFGTTFDTLSDSDDVIVWHFYHVPIGDPNDETNPLRAGKYFACVGDIALPGADSRLPTSRKTGLPIVEMMSSPMEHISFGYADYWDLLACQQGQDQIYSDVLSNVSTFGRLNMFYPEGSEIDLDQLAAGGGAFQIPPNTQAPQFMQPAPMTDAASWMSGECDGKKQSISGLNAVMRGNPGSNISSGEMAALFTNLSVEFNGDRQTTLDEFRRSLANVFADLIELNAENELLIQISGEDDRPAVMHFRADMLKGVRAIEMQTAPPMMRNAAGRTQIFKLLQGVDPKERGAFMRLLNSGQWREAGDTSSAKWLLINWENEQLAKGMTFTPPPMGTPPELIVEEQAKQLAAKLGVKVSATDDPFVHVPQHVKLYNQLAVDPKANASQIAAVLAHIQEHTAQYYRMDPMLAALNAVQPPPPPSQPANDNGDVPGKPEDKGGAVQDGATAKPADRLGSNVPQPAQPPKGASVQGAPA